MKRKFIIWLSIWLSICCLTINSRGQAASKAANIHSSAIPKLEFGTNREAIQFADLKDRIKPAAASRSYVRPITQVLPSKAKPIMVQGSIAQIIVAAANEFGIDPNRMLRIARCESGFRPNAVNGIMRGLFQHHALYWLARVNKFNASNKVPVSNDYFDPTANARVSAWMMKNQGFGAWTCR